MKKIKTTATAIMVTATAFVLFSLLSLSAKAQKDNTNLVAKMALMKSTLSTNGLHQVQVYSNSSVYAKVSKGVVTGYVVMDTKNNIIPSAVGRSGGSCRLCWTIDKKKTCVTVPCTSIRIDHL